VINKDLNSNLKISNEKGNFIGGIILKNGNTYINLTLDATIEQLKDELDRELDLLLFNQ